MADSVHGTANHDYHMVKPSPWPVIGALGGGGLGLGGVVIFMHTGQLWLMTIGGIVVCSPCTSGGAT